MFRNICFVVLAAIVVAFSSGGAFAQGTGGVPRLRAEYYTKSYIVGGKSDYSAKPEFLFSCVGLEEDAAIADEKGTLTLNSAGRTKIWWLNLKTNKYSDGGEFSGAKDFQLLPTPTEFGIGHYVAHADGRQAEFYKSEMGLSGQRFTYSFDGLKTDGAFPKTRAAGEQMRRKFVPYFEYIRDGKKITGVNWRFVDPANPSVALANESGPLKLGLIFRVLIEGANGKIIYDDFLRHAPADDEMLEGTAIFSSPVDEKSISIAKIVFDYADSFGENSNSRYGWFFFTK
jgi:hypothetical protein